MLPSQHVSYIVKSARGATEHLAAKWEIMQSFKKKSLFSSLCFLGVLEYNIKNNSLPLPSQLEKWEISIQSRATDWLQTEEK